LLFAASNGLKTEMASKVGYLSVLYNSTGTVLVCLVYDFKAAWANYRENGVFWHH